MTTQPSASAVTISDERIAEIAAAVEDIAENAGLPIGFKYVLQNAAAALRSAPAPEWQGMESADIETVAWNCDMWPDDLSAQVEAAMEVSDRLDMSTEQVLAYAILSTSPPAAPSKVVEDDDPRVVAIATLYGNFIPGHGWTGFGPSPAKIAAALGEAP